MIKLVQIFNYIDLYILNVTDFNPKGTISEAKGTNWMLIDRQSRFSKKFWKLFDHHGKMKGEVHPKMKLSALACLSRQ